MESPAGPKVPSERPPDLPSQEDLSVDQRAQVNPEPISLGPGSNLQLKGDQNINEPVSIDSVKKEQQKEQRDLTEKRFLNNLNHFYYEYIKDIPNGPKPTLEQFDDYLYRWAEKVWPRALDVIHEYSRNKYAKR